MPQSLPLPTLGFLQAAAAQNTEEHRHFKAYLQRLPTQQVDAMAAAINAQIEPAIDCLACGRCCQTLMINVEPADAQRLARHLHMNTAAFNQQYLEQGHTFSFMNQVPCPFLNQKACTVYSCRPQGCRSFPQMDAPGFASRLFATFTHYAMCPIVYYVVEALKQQSGFYEAE